MENIKFKENFNNYGIDMTQMIMNKLVKNAEKYPAK